MFSDGQLGGLACDRLLFNVWQGLGRASVSKRHFETLRGGFEDISQSRLKDSDLSLCMCYNLYLSLLALYIFPIV